LISASQSLIASAPLATELVTSGDYIYFPALLATKPAEVPTYESVKAEVAKALRTQKAIDAARADAKEKQAAIAKALAAGEPLEKAAGDLTFTDTKSFKHQASPYQQSPDMAASLMDIREPIIELAKDTKVGDLSPAFNTSTGAILFYAEEHTVNVFGEEDFMASYMARMAPSMIARANATQVDAAYREALEAKYPAFVNAKWQDRLLEKEDTTAE
jgi:hypothetical protein